MPVSFAEEQAVAALARQFPGVPTRIIGAVLVAYLRMTGSLADAVAAAQDRLSGACAA